MVKHVVARCLDISEGQQKRVSIAGRDICVFNIKGSFFALLDRCPHEGASLSHGFRVGLVTSTSPGCFQYSRESEMVKCPWHGWEFDIKTGQSWCAPTRVRVRPYPTDVESGGDLVKGPYVAESFPVSLEGHYVVIDL
jgi:nitrite reductase/ring-hydroxylating ferredoxin subunit